MSAERRPRRLAGDVPGATVIGPGEPRLRAVFDGLANGGTLRVPLAKQFWGDIFGAITNKYGIAWQVNIGSAGA
jgi:PhnB protein